MVKLLPIMKDTPGLILICGFGFVCLRFLLFKAKEKEHSHIRHIVKASLKLVTTFIINSICLNTHKSIVSQTVEIT